MPKNFAFKRINIKYDFIIVFFILIIPFLFYLYTVAPKNVAKWDTKLFNINILNSGYNIEDMLWVLSYSLLTLFIFCLWYLTCKYKWRYAILIPIIVETHKLISFIYDLNNNIINYKFYYSLILSLAIILFLTILSQKLNYYTLSKSINQQIDIEIEALLKNTSKLTKFKNSYYRELKHKLLDLREEKKNLEKKEYLKRLIKLREELQTK